MDTQSSPPSEASPRESRVHGHEKGPLRAPAALLVATARLAVLRWCAQARPRNPLLTFEFRDSAPPCARHRPVDTACLGHAPRRSFAHDWRCATRRRAQPPQVRRQRFLTEFGSRLRRDAARAALRTMLRCVRVRSPQLLACTCSPLTFALRWSCCCSVLRGRRAPSPPSRTRSRRAPRRDAGPFSSIPVSSR